MKLKGMNPALFASIVLTGLRVVLGVFWLLQLTWKPPPTFGCPEGFCLWVGLEIQYPVIPLYGEFVKAVIQPNIYLVGWVTTIIEVLIGLSLVFGLFTRLGALVGVGWSINLLIGLANIPHETGWYYGFLIMLNVVFLAIGASGQWSIDRMRGFRHWFGRAAPTLF